MTVKQFLSFHPCESIARFAKERDYNWEKVWNECPRGDWLIWWIGKMKVATKAELVTMACAFARRALPIFERQRAGDSRPRAAIKAAQRWVQQPSDENMAAAADASYEAVAASAADAASADSAAAASAADAAYAALKKERLWQADFVRSKVKFPFAIKAAKKKEVTV